ncbi:MAG: heme ABC transporter ATP-binding protein [Syntrophorhabdaceae bacterium]|nr:heme ABC transporter ATP-binding protein [Syntrophorhabdaceae bacterium]
MNRQVMLSIENVSFSYAKKEVIHNISLKIEEGEFVGIIGPNGSGKSTLLKISAGFLKPDKGEVYFLGRDIKEYDTKELARHIATLPQSVEVFFPHNVEDFIAMGRYPHIRRGFFKEKEKERELINDIMETMDIQYMEGRRITDLSEGERQRVFLAQCIAQDPVLLLLDEPVSHFDIRYQIKTLETLENLNKDGMTVVIVLHDLNLASEFCTRIVLMSEGKIYKEGSPHDVLTFQNIEEIYRTVVIVKENPISGKPYIIPISKKYL